MKYYLMNRNLRIKRQTQARQYQVTVFTADEKAKEKIEKNVRFLDKKYQEI